MGFRIITREKGEEMENIEDIASYIVSDGKGILAADESNPTCTKRFESIGVESTEDKRREYRDCLLYTSPSPRDGLLSRMPSSA